MYIILIYKAYICRIIEKKIFFKYNSLSFAISVGKKKKNTISQKRDQLRFQLRWENDRDVVPDNDQLETFYVIFFS